MYEIHITKHKVKKEGTARSFASSTPLKKWDQLKQIYENTDPNKSGIKIMPELARHTCFLTPININVPPITSSMGVDYSINLGNG